jgi:hypothetical protein
MHVQAEFLQPPSPADIVAAEERWNNRVWCAISSLPACMVCSVEIEEDVEQRDIDVDSIPNRNLLLPEAHHPAHELYDGLLLNCTALRKEDGVYRGLVCMTCFQDLDNAKPPVLSLANGSWFGPIPTELQDLTIAEQTLIALHPHTTYHISFNGDAGSPMPLIHRWSLHPMAVDCMELASILPLPLEVLESALEIDFADGLALNEAMYTLLLVRRQKVLGALLWLKDHN